MPLVIEDSPPAKPQISPISSRQSGLFTALLITLFSAATQLTPLQLEPAPLTLWPTAGIALVLLLYSGRAGSWIAIGAALLAAILLQQRIPTTDDLLAMGVNILLPFGFALSVRWLLHRLNIQYPGALPIRRLLHLFGLLLLLSGLFAFLLTQLLQSLLPSEVVTPFDWQLGGLLLSQLMISVAVIPPLLLTLLSSRNQRQSAIISILLPIGSLLLVLIALQHYTERTIVERGEDNIRLRLQATENRLTHNINRYMAVISGLKVTLDRLPEITPLAFHQITQPQLDRYPGIKALSWNPVVHNDELATFIAASKAQVAANFSTRGDPLLPTDPRVIVQLIEPYIGNEKARGFNVYSHPARKAAMLQSVRQQVPIATDIIQLVQSDRPEPGFLAFVPLFGGDEKVTEPLQAPLTLQGYAVGVFLVEQIVSQALYRDLLAHVKLYIYANYDPSNSVLGDPSLLQQAVGTGLNHEFQVAVAQQQWHLNLHVDAAAVAAVNYGAFTLYNATILLLTLLSLVAILGSAGRQQQLAQLVAERTESLQQANLQLEQLAFYDELSGLPNRHQFRSHLQHIISEVASSYSQFALLLIDLVGFKRINDTLGYEAGDALLCAVADRLRPLAEEFGCYLARIGGNEYALATATSATGDMEGVESLVERLTRLFDEPLTIGNQQLTVAISIGITLYPQDDRQVSGLLRCANIALHQAKQEPQRRCYYHPALFERATRQLFMENNLPRVLDMAEFILHFQPIINNRHPERISCEALLRWQHPTIGLIYPTTFIPTAERTGDIIQIGRWVVMQCCRNWHEWREQGVELQQISLNISMVQLLNREFVSDVAQIISDAKIDPAVLQLEISEIGLAEHAEHIDQIVKRLGALRGLGFRIALDDFGGSKLAPSEIKGLPIDEIKVDRLYLNDVATLNPSQTIVKAAVELAQSMDIEVTAEGVERAQQVAILNLIGCHQFQGNHFSRPLSASDYLAWVTEHQKG